MLFLDCSTCVHSMSLLSIQIHYIGNLTSQIVSLYVTFDVQMV